MWLNQIPAANPIACCLAVLTKNLRLKKVRLIEHVFMGKLRIPTHVRKGASIPVLCCRGWIKVCYERTQPSCIVWSLYFHLIHVLLGLAVKNSFIKRCSMAVTVKQLPLLPPKIDLSATRYKTQLNFKNLFKRGANPFVDWNNWGSLWSSQNPEPEMIENTMGSNYFHRLLLQFWPC